MCNKSWNHTFFQRLAFSFELSIFLIDLFINLFNHNVRFEPNHKHNYSKTNTFGCNKLEYFFKDGTKYNTFFS